MKVSRRALMLSAGTAALGSALPLRRSFAETEIKKYRLTAKTAVVNLTGDGHPDTAVWTYDGTVPGPELRVRQGDPLRLVVSNKLGEDTTVHWHGIRLPNAMDGVPGLTQPPIRPGESFTYDFTPPDAPRRELRLRLPAARCGQFLVSPARGHAATRGTRACGRLDRPGTGAGP